MKRIRVIVQASSRSWSGGKDLCMATVDDHPVVYWTVKRILDYLPGAAVTIAAPAFDRGGSLEFLLDHFQAERVSIFYGHDASPLNRMLNICQDLSDKEHIIRVDGLHFCVDIETSVKMLLQAELEGLDCVKMPDDFPVQFTSDIYKVGALRQLDRILQNDRSSIFLVHPKFYLFMNRGLFRCAYQMELPQYSSEYLKQCREIAKVIYCTPRMEVNEHLIPPGDQLTFHYELALKYLHPQMKVLDIACGNGYGTYLLAPEVAEVHGADIDPEVINEAKLLIATRNVSFHIEDVTQMSFPSNEFNAIISMETIEHVDEVSYMREVYRVLKPGGTLVLSTPQNRLGHIPVNATHRREYSLEEIVALCSQVFTIKEVIGIKSGRIVIPHDPYGTNTVLVCVK